ncbi:septum formation family protein [Cryobacterium sp. SO1]|uniref:septum formation family protein n=1 Tax=Cryobacterium sp. SO1 TaxID=1897061 RepID=UPI0010232F42|nr:septum formation family protein [Cryobacterium sp. SO1]RZI34305.1 hypothetical protein BJQ95_03446 [Cryobacterium sp. SO1]
MFGYVFSENKVRAGRLALGAVLAGMLVAGASGCAGQRPDIAEEFTAQRALPADTPSAFPIPAPEGSPADAQLFHPEVGQCVDVRKDGPTGPESVVPCTETHDDEAYARVTLGGADGVEYPGEATTQELANTLCRQEFADFVGIRYEDSVFEFLPMYPSESSWNLHADRRVTCLIWYPSDSLTVSLRGAGY